eukprot:TRINITY_DN5794_c0_g1_i5.p1 TRINITY_DN5794_c0_g1~~TRINITY_DN5794_c0_g1_i5.p1  ORF type:complete len:279 (+),score=54.83 TRINITY_DN5794_c0_g1_i5:104-940(+)
MSEMLEESAYRSRQYEEVKFRRSKNATRRAIRASSLQRSRKDFLISMDRVNKLEQASYSSYLKDFITRNLPASQTRYVRTMPTHQKELLMKYLAKKNPKVNGTIQLNLFQISQSVPTNFYTRSVVTKHDWRNKSSMLKDMSNSTDLTPSEKAKLTRILKSSRKVTNYSLTKKFLQNLDSQISTYDGLISAMDFINKAPKKDIEEIAQDEYLAIASRMAIPGLSAITNCHFFIMGFKGVIIPFANSDFYFINLYGIAFDRDRYERTAEAGGGVDERVSA